MVFRVKSPDLLDTSRFFLTKLKHSLSMEILSINDFFNKLLSNYLRDLSNRVHFKSISKFINKVIKTNSL